MPNHIPDHIPVTPAPTDARPAVRHGGARPNAGARPGNLNALKHGRYSRFRDELPLSPSDTAAARRLLLAERREAEHHALTPCASPA